MAGVTSSDPDDPTGGRGGRIELVGLVKRFGDAVAVDGIDVEIASGEFYSLLGPSGCGKTTTLRMIGGFERPTEGAIRVDGMDVAHVPPEKRPINTVFQSYALFPHMSVWDNVAFGLRFASGDKASRRTRVGNALELVQLTALAKRKPHELSGGQQQRVALARALVLEPRVLLLDEPLGALDAQLRKALQRELSALHREVGVTFVYVTHDQEEALTMSDRVAVMNHGRIEQCARPRDIYERPETPFVASFLGVENLLRGDHLGGGLIDIGGWHLQGPTQSAQLQHGACHVVVRPERVRLAPPGSGDAASLSGTVSDVVYLGPLTKVRVELADTVEGGVQTIEAIVTNDGTKLEPARGHQVDIALPPDSLHVIPGDVSAEVAVPDPEEAVA